MVERWKGLTKRQGTGISKFMAEHVENSLMQEEEPEYKSRSSLIEENQKLKERLEEKEKRIRHLGLLVDKLEEDLRRYRVQLWVDEDFTGVRRLDRRLIEILRELGVHSGEEFLSQLGIKPTEHETIHAIYTAGVAPLITHYHYDHIESKNPGILYVDGQMTYIFGEIYP